MCTSQLFSRCCLWSFFLFHVFRLCQFLFQLSMFLSLDALLDFLFEPPLLCPDLLQLGLPLGLHVWILGRKDDHKLATVFETL